MSGVEPFSDLSAPLHRGVVEVRCATIDLPPRLLAQLRDDLDDATRTRIARLTRPDDRRRATVAHGLLRRRVGGLLGVGPTALRLRTHCAVCGADDHGKPEIAPVAGVAPPPSMNLSHAGRRVAVALRADGPVGVDVESVDRDVDWARMRQHVFAAEEWSATERAPDPQAARLAAWSRKEAAAKATGHGIAIGLQRLVIAESAGPEAWFAVTAPDGVGPLLTCDLPLGGDHLGAVAVTADAPLGAPDLRLIGDQMLDRKVGSG